MGSLTTVFHYKRYMMLLQLNYDTRLAAKRRVLIEAKFEARLAVSDDGELD
jgi:hypothetical protein